jgi:hypothetical protein
VQSAGHLGFVRSVCHPRRDNKLGRWVSNLAFIDVAAVPEAPTWVMMLAGFAGLGLEGAGSGARSGPGLARSGRLKERVRRATGVGRSKAAPVNTVADDGGGA